MWWWWFGGVMNSIYYITGLRTLRDSDSLSDLLFDLANIE